MGKMLLNKPEYTKHLFLFGTLIVVFNGSDRSYLSWMLLRWLDLSSHSYIIAEIYHNALPGSSNVAILMDFQPFSVSKKQLLGNQRLPKVHEWPFSITKDPWATII